jgi:hypothetical protein
MPTFQENVQITFTGSPTLSMQSRGNGTQHYSIRVTNNQDPAGGRNFIIRNEDHSRDELIIDNSGNISVSGDIQLIGADCAEVFDLGDGLIAVEPGTVMVIDQDGKLQISEEAYDRKVAGVVAGAGDYRPGIVLGKSVLQAQKPPIALVGRVYCKVDASYGTIAVGDLLTTSPTPGHAMKVVDPLRAFGAVIGKALAPFGSGQSLIPILVALQ